MSSRVLRIDRSQIIETVEKRAFLTFKAPNKLFAPILVDI